MTVLGLALAGFPGVANAKVISCYEHEAYHQDSGGHGTSNGKSVTLNPFNPAWDTGTRWESLTLFGTEGTTVINLPAPGVYDAQGALLSWEACKGEPDAVTTTVAAPTTTAASSVSTPASVPVPVVTATTPAPGVTTTAPEITTQITTQDRLPETGNGWVLAVVAALMLGVGAPLAWRFRRSRLT